MTPAPGLAGDPMLLGPLPCRPDHAVLAAAPAPRGVPPETAAALLVQMLLLLIVVVFGGLAILIALRRFRSSLHRRSPAPSPTDDVWSMHKTPELPPEGDAGEQHGEALP